jgi:ribosome-binding factor A
MTQRQKGDYKVGSKKNIRSNRMNKAIRDVVAGAIIGHPSLMYEKITISYVDTSSDLRFARIYFSVIGTEQQKREQTVIMQDLKSFFRKIISQKIPMRYTPNIEVTFDKSLEAIDKILEYEKIYGNYAELAQQG